MTTNNGRPRKPHSELRRERIGIPVTAEEKRAIVAAAERQGMGHVTWMRMLALRETRK